MTKKDYELLASVLVDAYSTTVTQRLRNPASAKEALEFTSEQLARRLKGDNPRFNRERFLAACGYGDAET